MRNTLFVWISRVFIGLLFVVVLIIVLLEANGFRYDFRHMDLQKTSVIYLDNYIKGSIYVDDELLGESAPRQISGLLPGKYFLKIQKEGFFDWTDEIDLYVDYVKRIKNVLLIPQKLEQYGRNLMSLSQSDLWVIRQGYVFEIKADGSIYYAKLIANFDKNRMIKMIGVDVEGVSIIGIIGNVVRIYDRENSAYYYDLNKNIKVNSDERTISDYAYSIEASKLNFIRSNQIFSSVSFNEQTISDVNAFNLGGEEFVRVELEGENGYRLYVLNSGKLSLVAKNIISGPFWHDDFGYLIMDENNSIYLLEKTLVKAALLGRFFGDVKLLGYFSEFGYFLIQEKGIISW